MIEDNVLDQKHDFEIIFGSDENQTVMDAFIYQMEANLDHWSSYYE